MIILIRSPWCGITHDWADQLKRRRVNQGANDSPHSLATSPHKPSPCYRGWLPRANLSVPNTTLPIVCQWAIPRRRVPGTLSIHSADLAIARTWLLHPPAHCAPMPILASYVDQALAGEKVVIARAVKPLVRLVQFQTQPAPRLGGFLRG